MMLLSTVHDPDGKLAYSFRLMMPFLATIYTEMAFCVTERTHAATLEALGNSAKLNNAEGAANGRRCCLSLGLDGNSQVFHYCDSDRILFWAYNHPSELRDTIRQFNHTKYMVILGRTREAMNSHPFFQRITEHIINLSTFSGIDYLTGSRIIPAGVAHKILEHSTNDNAAALDVEWPKIVGDFIYIQVNGLAYEHRLFDLEKPLSKEIPVRLQNMVSAIGVRWQNVG